MKTKRMFALLLTMLMVLSIVQPCMAAAADSAVELVMDESAVKGSGETVECTVTGITAPVYTWTSDNTDVLEVTGSGATASIKYKTEGTATVTVTATGSEGTYTDSVTVTVSGDIVTNWDEYIDYPAVQWTHYELVDAPQVGKNYVIANSNTAGTSYMFYGQIDSDNLKTSSATVKAGDDTSGDRLYIDPSQTRNIWTASGSADAMILTVKDGNDVKSLKANIEIKNGDVKKKQLLLQKNDTSTASQWTYSNHYLMSVYNSAFGLGMNGTSYQVNNSGFTPVYFYEETQHETPAWTETVPHTDTTPTEYAPQSTLKYNNANANGKRYNIYNTPVGTEIKLEGSYTGYAQNGAVTNAVWSSSNTDAATVENGVVTVTGTGLTEISYTVSDGTTELVKKMLLNVSQGSKTYDTYVLTDTLEAGKQYAIVSGYSASAVKTAAMTCETVDYPDNYCKTCMDDVDVVIEGSGTDVSFMSDNEMIAFFAEEDDDGNIFFRDYYGNYLKAEQHQINKDNDELNLSTTENRDDGSYITYASEGTLAVTYGEHRYSGLTVGYTADDGGYFYLRWGGTAAYLYEKTPMEPLAKIKYNDTYVNNTEMTIYSVNSNSSLSLAGEYYNFPGPINGVWSSSDESIATVDQNGFVQFTGEVGEVVITYTATDTEDDTVTASSSVTFTTTYQKDPKRVFKPTTTITAGKKYIVVSARSVGASFVMNYDESSRSSKALSYDYHVIQLDRSDNSLYIEIKADELQNIWTASASSTSGSYYLVNEETGEYLYGSGYSNSDGVLDTGALNTKNNTWYSWKMQGNGLVTAAGPNIHFSTSSLYFRASENNTDNSSEITSNVFLYEETELLPVVKIYADSVIVDGKEVSRNEVCAYQTDNLAAKPYNFTTSNVTLEWSSDNDAVAVVDPDTGVLTYTGNPGTVEVTVTAYATVPNEDGGYDTEEATASTTITVISVESDIEVNGQRYMLANSFVPGQYYAFAADNTAGEHGVMNCWAEYSGTDKEGCAWSYGHEFIKNNSTTYFDSDIYSDAIAWECIDAGNGHFYFQNSEGYLLLHSNGDYRVVDVTSALNATGSSSRIAYGSDAYLFNQYDNTNKRVSTVMSASDDRYLSYGPEGWGKYILTDNPKNLYIYRQCDPSESTPPVAQIRQDAFGGNKIISNNLLTRNDIAEGDTERLLCYTENFDSITGIQWTSSNSDVATIDENGLITYTGREGIVTFTLEVSGIKADAGVFVRDMVSMFVSPDPYEMPTEDYPEYPHEGSVRINKKANSIAGGSNFQTSGVAEVELSVTGVSMNEPVDVLIVFDHSSSMNSSNRLQNAIEDTRDFALQIVSRNEKNRVAIVTFDRYEDKYNTLSSTTANYSSNPYATENRIITGDGTYDGAFVSADDATELVAQIDSLIYNDIEGTNYDDGLEQAYKILQASKNDPNANEKQYVIFMSDGEPYAYNRLRINYEESAYEAWLRGDETNQTIKNMLANPTAYPVINYFHPDGKHWIAEAIKAEEGVDAGLPNVDYYDPYRLGLGVDIYSIGYSRAASGALTTLVLQNIATNPDRMYYAESDLQVVYDEILNSILYSAKDGVVTDKMGESFNLQFATEYTTGNDDEITLDPEPFIEIGSWKLNSDSTRSDDYQLLEKILFNVNENGVLTAAYSSQDNYTQNIYNATTNMIQGSYVSYDLDLEEFTWNIGDITRDEVTLKYYAYLEGSMEGEREAGLYDTNEYAELDYTNYLGHPCNQVFPVPRLGWQQAVMTYEFYLVNELGQPVNSDGVVVPFSERVLIEDIQSKVFNLNTSTTEYAVLAAADLVPEDYILFNDDASYRVTVSSGDNTNEAEIDDEADVVTTYYYDGDYYFNKDGIVEGVSDYTYTHVAFAVKRMLNIRPDTVVIDYGLPVKIHALRNDIVFNTEGSITAISSGLTSETVQEIGRYKSSRISGDSASVGEKLTLNHGEAYIDDDTVVYTPTDMLMDSEEEFYYEFTTKDGDFLYAKITVIPAANIYYEDSFITFTDGDGYEWKTAGEEYTDVFQAEDRPGYFKYEDLDANNPYGRDNAYDNNSTTYSLGSAKYVELDAASVNHEPTAEFSFCGTGFDFFSCTNSDTGAVLVDVTKNGKKVANKIINTYYGYTYGRVYLDENDEITLDESGEALYLAPEITPDVYKVDGKLCWTTPTYFEEDGITLTSENTGDPAYASGWVVTTSENGLYQVPVIRLRGLEYGTYDVKITPKYAKMFDMNYSASAESNSYKVYVDAIRIYDPAGIEPDQDSVIGKAYIADKEYVPQYIELRAQVIADGTFYNSTKELDGDGLTAGVVFIDGMTQRNANDIGDNTVSNSYLSAGPNNELYLAKGQAIAFHLKSKGNVKPETLQLGMKTVAGGVSSVICMNSNDEDAVTIRVAGGSEQYRDISSAVVWDEEALARNEYQTKYPIIIMNNSDTVVSLTSLKWTYLEMYADDEDNGGMLMMAAAPSTPKMAVRALKSALAPQPKTVTVSTDGVSVSWKEGTVKKGSSAVLQIVTPMEIAGVTVDGISVTECASAADGNKIWSYEFTAEEVGEFSYPVILKDSAGNESDVIMTEAITVEEAPVIPEPSKTEKKNNTAPGQEKKNNTAPGQEKKNNTAPGQEKKNAASEKAKGKK